VVPTKNKKIVRVLSDKDINKLFRCLLKADTLLKALGAGIINNIGDYA